MNVVLTKTHHKLGVTLNYISLVLLVALVYVAEAFGLTLLTGVGIGLMVVMLVATLVRFHFRTGLWRLVHTSRSRLSEHQVPVVCRSLHYSYGVFAILALVALLWKSVAPGENPNLVIVFAALLYLAHTQPSAVIAWSERDITSMWTAE